MTLVQVWSDTPTKGARTPAVLPWFRLRIAGDEGGLPARARCAGVDPRGAGEPGAALALARDTGDRDEVDVPFRPFAAVRADGRALGRRGRCKRGQGAHRRRTQAARGGARAGLRARDGASGRRRERHRRRPRETRARRRGGRCPRRHAGGHRSVAAGGQAGERLGEAAGACGHRRRGEGRGAAAGHLRRRGVAQGAAGCALRCAHRSRGWRLQRDLSRRPVRAHGHRGRGQAQGRAGAGRTDGTRSWSAAKRTSHCSR